MKSELVETVAEVCADLEGQGDAFRDERDGIISESDVRHQGIYEGGLALAQDLITALEAHEVTVTWAATASRALAGSPRLRAVSQDLRYSSVLRIPPNNS